jgi:2-oxoglutarate ferredoxin oxidoreductase subunit gamma
MHLVAMNRPSLEKFAPMVKPKGVVVINSSLISIGAGRDDVDELRVPANDIAKDLGSTKVANIVALGAFVARSKIVDFEVMRKCVQEQFASREKLIPINMAALDAGKKAARLK